MKEVQYAESERPKAVPCWLEGEKQGRNEAIL